MATAALSRWKPGTDLPYVLPLGEGKMLAINLAAAWVKADRAGKPLLLPPAVRALDRLRAVLASQDQVTPGFIISLREAMGMTQAEFGQKLGISKMTVSRWECGRMRPNPAKAKAILKLQSQARRTGVQIDGEKGAARHPAPRDHVRSAK